MITVEQLSDDICLEIIYGCDRFDKEDVNEMIALASIDRSELRQLTETKLTAAIDRLGDAYSGNANDEFHQRQLNYWCNAKGTVS